VSFLREQEGEEADERVRAQVGRQVRVEPGRVGMFELLGRELLHLRTLKVKRKK